MGPYLTTPKKEKEIENGENTRVLRLNLRYNQCLIGKIWCMWYARLEKHNGRFSHSCFINRYKRSVVWSL
jgi:hypothetical protein